MEIPNEWIMVDFVGGPLDGPNPVHPTQNSMLWVPSNPDGIYVYLNGKYYWERRNGEQTTFSY